MKYMKYILFPIVILSADKIDIKCGNIIVDGGF